MENDTHHGNRCAVRRSRHGLPGGRWRIGRRLLASAAFALLSACMSGNIVLEADETVVGAGLYPSSVTPPPSNSGILRSADANVLILTSGGADGAFGAGVLNAWSAGGRRPVFDVVSGVSTGALQATPAFLGKSRDAWLKHVYTTTRTRDVFCFNGLKTITGSGMYDPFPLRRLLMEFISEDLLDEVASAHKAGRRLYVVTTDMTLGKAVFWDMGAIATAGKNRRSNYVDILIASVAAPGLIEPVSVEDRRQKIRSLHADGALKTPVPLASFMLPANNADGTQVWVIANGHVSRDAALRSEAGTSLTLARRGIAQLIRQLLHVSVQEAGAMTVRTGAHFHLIALPVTIPEAVNPFEFRPSEMKSLFETGWAVGAQTFGI